MLKRFAAFHLILAYSLCQTASAQRVINQDSSGLNRPPQTQIPGGSLSRSAQGYGGHSSQLPNTQLGPHVQPGDSTSRPLPAQSRLQSHLQPQAQPQASGLAPAQLGPHVMPGDISRTDLHPNRPHGSGLQPAMLGPRIAPGDISRSDMNPGYYKRNKEFWVGKKQQSRAHQAAQPVQNQPVQNQPAPARYETAPAKKMAF